MNEDNKALRAITWVTAVMLFAKLLAVVRSILQARVFGAGADVDLFTQASNYTVSMFTTVAFALSVAAVPLFSKKLLSDRENCYKTANIIISDTLIISAAVTALLLILDAAGVMNMIAGMSAGARMFRDCFAYLALSLPIIMVTYLLVALFQSIGHYSLQGSLSLLYSIALCAALSLFGGMMTLRAFAVLTSAGWLLQTAMVVPYIIKEKYKFRFRPDFHVPELKPFLRTGAVTVFTTAIFLFCYLVNTRFAVFGRGGLVSAYYYADRVYEPLTTTIIYSISIVLFPQFSKKFEQMSSSEYHGYVGGVIKNTLLLILPVSIIFSVFAVPVVRVLFEGGSFKTEDALLTGDIFAMYSVGMAGFFMLDLLSKAYFAMEKTLAPLLVNAGVLLLCVLIEVFGRMAFPNIASLPAAATSFSMLLGGAALYVMFIREEHVRFPAAEIAGGAALTAAMGTGLYFCSEKIIARANGKLSLILICAALGTIGMLVYLAAVGLIFPSQRKLINIRRKP